MKMVNISNDPFRSGLKHGVGVKPAGLNITHSITPSAPDFSIFLGPIASILFFSIFPDIKGIC